MITKLVHVHMLLIYSLKRIETMNVFGNNIEILLPIIPVYGHDIFMFMDSL